MRRVAVFALFVMLPMVAVPGTAVAAAKEVDSLTTAATDVEVFMRVGAAHRKVDAVRQVIRNSPEVSRYAHRGQQAAFREFQKIFHGAPSLDATRASDLSESFRVELRHPHDAKDFARTMRRRAGVDSAVLGHQIPSESDLLITIRHCQESGDADLEVFMRLDATQADVDAVVAAVATQPDLSVTRILSQDDAYEAFRTIFAGNPELVDAIGPDALPRSVRVRATSSVSDAETRMLGAVSGVDTVESTPALCTSVREQLARGITPEGLARLIHDRTAGTSS
jgi:cell division protein FtsX